MRRDQKGAHGLLFGKIADDIVERYQAFRMLSQSAEILGHRAAEVCAVICAGG